MVSYMSVVYVADYKNYRKSTKKRGIISVALTLFIILMLIFSGPASAVQIQMDPVADVYSGKPVIFKVHVEFQTDDINVPIRTINVTGLPEGDLSFSKHGIQLSGSDNYDVALIQNTATYGYGYGYGYDYGNGYDFGYGYGYGYNSAASGLSKLTYEIKISNLPISTYDSEATIKVITESDQHIFSATHSYLFKVKSSGGGGSSGGSYQNAQTQTMRNGAASFWGTIGNIIPSIEIPGANGSITVEHLSSNPTSVNFGEHVFFYLDIDAEDNSNKAGTINFKVSATSLANAGIDRNNIAFYRFNNGNWEELPTQWLKTVDGYEVYAAQTSGFSAFLISEKGVTPIVTATMTPTSTPTSTPAEGPADGIEEPAPDPTKKKGIPGFGAVALMTGVLMAAHIIMRKRG